MRHLFLLFFCLTLGLEAAAADSLALSKEHWAKITEDVDYSEDVEKKEPEEPKEFDTITPVDGNEDPFDFDSIRTVLFATLIAIALLVLVFIIKNAKAPASLAAPKIEATTLDEAEENLPDVELNNLLSNAMDEGNWKVALRIQFLMLLQEMIYAEHIIWKKRKTNDQYVAELTDLHIKAQFGSAVNVFDPVWYGGTNLLEAEYQRIGKVIDELKSKVRNE